MPYFRKRRKIKSEKPNLFKEIEKASEGLYFISETDAEIRAFDGGKSEAVSAEIILDRTQTDNSARIEEKSFEDFFERLTKLEDWFEEEETENARRFAYLRDLLKNNLRDLRVFRIGEIQIKIYVIGLDAENNLLGIQTEAVET